MLKFWKGAEYCQFFFLPSPLKTENSPCKTFPGENSLLKTFHGENFSATPLVLYSSLSFPLLVKFLLVPLYTGASQGHLVSAYSGTYTTRKRNEFYFFFFSTYFELLFLARELLPSFGLCVRAHLLYRYGERYQ